MIVKEPHFAGPLLLKKSGKYTRNDPTCSSSSSQEIKSKIRSRNPVKTKKYHKKNFQSSESLSPKSSQSCSQTFSSSISSEEAKQTNKNNQPYPRKYVRCNEEEKRAELKKVSDGNDKNRQRKPPNSSKVVEISSDSSDEVISNKKNQEKMKTNEKKIRNEKNIPSHESSEEPQRIVSKAKNANKRLATNKVNDVKNQDSPAEQKRAAMKNPQTPRPKQSKLPILASKDQVHVSETDAEAGSGYDESDPIAENESYALVKAKRYQQPTAIKSPMPVKKATIATRAVQNPIANPRILHQNKGLIKKQAPVPARKLETNQIKPYPKIYEEEENEDIVEVKPTRKTRQIIKAPSIESEDVQEEYQEADEYEDQYEGYQDQYEEEEEVEEIKPPVRSVSKIAKQSATIRVPPKKVSPAVSSKKQPIKQPLRQVPRRYIPDDEIETVTSEAFIVKAVSKKVNLTNQTAKYVNPTRVYETEVEAVESPAIPPTTTAAKQALFRATVKPQPEIKKPLKKQVIAESTSSPAEDFSGASESGVLIERYTRKKLQQEQMKVKQQAPKNAKPVPTRASKIQANEFVQKPTTKRVAKKGGHDES